MNKFWLYWFGLCSGLLIGPLAGWVVLDYMGKLHQYKDLVCVYLN